VVVPGKGVAACQASGDTSHYNQMLVFEELHKGTNPKEIIEMLRNTDQDFEHRQFGILDIKGRMAGHSGTRNGKVSMHIQGQVPDTKILYSIQGNILLNESVVINAQQAFISTTGLLTDRVMAAMEAADSAGGDRRCQCPIKSTILCDKKTAEVAYILASDQTDRSGNSHNNGEYALYLTVSQPGFGNELNQIKANENLNPVKTLRLRYNEWKNKNPQGRVATGPPSPRLALDCERVKRERTLRLIKAIYSAMMSPFG
jgi:uncharacterized Ntn-hydrolase superfamily protein